MIYLDICSLVTELHKNQEGCHPLNAGCGLTQFTIPTITTVTKAKSIANLFMEEVVLLFGTVAVVLVDSEIWFRGAF